MFVYEERHCVMLWEKRCCAEGIDIWGPGCMKIASMMSERRVSRKLERRDT